ncbi:MAG: P-loop NTPase [Acholeplasma sp.]|nr:P-loop NTPase [Acholeplasma sp.]
MDKRIIDSIADILDSKTGKSLEDLNAIKNVKILDNDVVKIELTNIDKTVQDEIKLLIAKVVKVDLKYPGVIIDFTFDNKEENTNNNGYKYLAIASGKGGVGKSTVTVNLAYALMRLGKKVGIIDVDIYGSSIPLLLNMPIKPLDLNEEERIIPAKFMDIEVVAMDFFVPKNQPLMWRAPLASQMTKMFFNDVAWDSEIDIILIDMPPGTGDIAIDVRELVPKSDMLIVTSPNINAANIAVKAGLGSKEIGHNILGVIENMSYYYNECSKERVNLFGVGGGTFVAKELGVDLLVAIPISDSDEAVFKEGSMQRKMYSLLAKNLG